MPDVPITRSNPASRDLIEIVARFGVDVPDQLALVARRERIALDEPFGEADDAELEAAPQLDAGAGAAGDLDAAAADVDDHRDVARHADAVDRRQVDEPGLFDARNHAGPDAGLGRDRLQELAAVLGFAGRARRDGHDLVDPVRFGQPPEFRQHLQRGVHRFGRERAAVEAAGAQPDHLLFPIDDLEREIGADPHDDHVQRIGPDIDGGNTHG